MACDDAGGYVLMPFFWGGRLTCGRLPSSTGLRPLICDPGAPCTDQGRLEFRASTLRLLVPIIPDRYSVLWVTERVSVAVCGATFPRGLLFLHSA